MAEQQSGKSTKKGRSVLVAAAAAVLLGAGSFYAIQSGMIMSGSHADPHDQKVATAEATPPLSFVPIVPLLVSLGPSGAPQNLRFEANLEVEPAFAKEVEMLMPRIMDVLNSYLRAVEISDLRDPSALMILRVQMLRRIQIVTGEGRVRDLLISQFLIS